MAQVRTPQIKHAAREILKLNCLALVVAQIRIPPLTRLADKSEAVATEFMRPFDAAILGSFPLRTIDYGINFLLSPEGAKQQEGERIFRYSDVNFDRSIAVTPNFISYEVRNYVDGEDFIRDFVQVLTAARDQLDVRYQLRFGLRYVNEFRHPNGETYEGWRSLINSQLLGFDAHELFGGDVDQTIAELRMTKENGIFQLRRGFLRGTTIPPIPGRPAQPVTGFYLFDMDYFNEKRGSFDIRPIERLREYSAFMYDVFRWATDGALYSYLQSGKSNDA